MSTVLWVCEFIHSSDCTFLYLILSNTFSLTDKLTNLHNFFFSSEIWNWKAVMYLTLNWFQSCLPFNSSHHAWEFLTNFRYFFLKKNILRLINDWLAWMMNLSNNNKLQNDVLIFLLRLLLPHIQFYTLWVQFCRKKIIIMHKSKF